MVSQTQLFLDGEGDEYFERNAKQNAAYLSKTEFFDSNLIREALSAFKPEIRAILEIGCGNGAKLNSLCAFFDAQGHGIDPSPKAVKQGNAAFPGLRLTVSPANMLSFPSRTFDLVYFGFCLYLVDRLDLSRAISEADRVLKPGRFLVIQDFDPPRPHKRPYHHTEGIFSYKQQYADLFLEMGHYHLISKASFSHRARHFDKDPNERVSMCVLYKEEKADLFAG